MKWHKILIDFPSPSYAIFLLGYRHEPRGGRLIHGIEDVGDLIKLDEESSVILDSAKWESNIESLERSDLPLHKVSRTSVGQTGENF